LKIHPFVGSALRNTMRFEPHDVLPLTSAALMSQERGFIGFIDWCPRRIEENYFRRQLPDFFDDFSMILKDSPLFFIVVH